MHKSNIFLSLTGKICEELSIYLFVFFQVITKEKQMQQPTIHFLDPYYLPCHLQTVQKDHKILTIPTLGLSPDRLQFPAQVQGFQINTKQCRGSGNKVIHFFNRNIFLKNIYVFSINRTSGNTHWLKHSHTDCLGYLG